MAGRSAIRKIARTLILAGAGVAALLVLMSPTGAQESYRVSVDQVVLGQDGAATSFVSVLDASGRPVAGILEADASIDGEAVDVESVQSVVGEGLGISVLLALDISGSMEGEPIARAKEAANGFVRSLAPQDSVAILTFSEAVEVAQPFSQDRAAAEGAINGIGVGGSTALFQAIAESLRLSTDQGGVRKAVVVLSDGLDNRSSVTRDEALAAAGASGVPFFIVGLGDADLTFLQELADRSRGRLYQAPQPADLQGMFEEIGNTLRSQYAIAVRLPASQNTQRELVVGIEIEGQRYTASYAFEAPAVAAPAAGSGSRAGYVFIPAALAVIAGAGALLYIRRRRRGKAGSVEPGPGADDAPLPAPETPTLVSRLSGRLTVVAGPNAGTSVPLRNGAVALGSDPACELRLDGGNGSVAAVHARAWLEHNRLMLHHVARRAQTLVGDRPIDWATLDPNDTLQIGPHVIAFALDPATPRPSRSV